MKILILVIKGKKLTCHAHTTGVNDKKSQILDIDLKNNPAICKNLNQ
jgi:hypothetical protein